MSFASRDELLSATKRRYRAVAAGGLSVRIRSLNEAEYALVDSRNLDLKKGGLSPTGIRESNVRLVIACVCDADGNQVFSEADTEAVAAIDSAVIEPLVRAIREHCGLKDDQETLAKNFEPTGGGGSPSSSPGPSPTT